MKAIQILAVLGFLLIAGCVTSPYQAAFDACDVEAGACYRYCEEVSGDEGEYSACHADCEAGANQCFADAYDRTAYRGYNDPYYAAPSWPWYGRYGAWGPSSGYYFDFSYWGGGSRYGRPRDRYDYNDRRRRRPRGDRNPARPGNDAEPQLQRRYAPPLRKGDSAPPVAPLKPAPPPQQAAPPSSSRPKPPAQPNKSAPPSQKRRVTPPKSRGENTNKQDY